MQGRGGNIIFYPTGKTNCPQNGAGLFPLTVRKLGEATGEASGEVSWEDSGVA